MAVQGTPGNDNLVGTSGDDFIEGFAGDDQLSGNDGNDTLLGGDGQDFLHGGTGDDWLDGGSGLQDWVFYDGAAGPVHIDLGAGFASGGAGNDTLLGIENAGGSSFDDLIVGDAGTNVLQGRGGNDTLDGAGGFDTIDYYQATGGVTVNLATGSATGADGNDTLFNFEAVNGSLFGDSITGDAGNNFIAGLAGDDILDGGGGFDGVGYFDASSAVTVNLATHQASGGSGNDTLINFESVSGSNFGDLLVGDDGNNNFSGNGGNDTIDGGAGSDNADYSGSVAGVSVNLATGTASDGNGGTDTLRNIESAGGSRFADVLVGDGGNNFFDPNAGDDTVDGGAGFDSVNYFSAAAGVQVDLQAGTVTGGSGNDRLFNIEAVNGSNFGDLLNGSVRQDNLFGNGGDDELHGGAEDDFLEGGAGNDTIDGGANGAFGDNVAYFNSTGGVNVDLAAGSASDGMGGTDTLIGIEHVQGSHFSDVLKGSEVTNWFRPDAGDDLVDGRGGQDVVMYEDAGAGVVIDLKQGFASGAAIGNDTLVSIEAAHGSRFDDSITLSDAGGYVFGRAGNDLLVGGALGDNFTGGSGNDTIDGGAGQDSVNYGDDSFDGLVATGQGVVVNLATGTATDNWGNTDRLVSIESVQGSNFADAITGGAAANEFFAGGAGNDTIRGGAGSDAFVGGQGNDVLDGGVITDLINYADLNSASYNTSTAAIDMNLATGVVQDGLGGTDTLSNINFVTGSNFNDRIKGSSGIYFEQFDGGLGNDTIDGGAIDPVSLGNANRVTYVNSGAAVTVNLASGTATGGMGNDTLININHVFGSRFADTLTGSDSAIPESFNGRGGNDLINGAGGIDEVRYTNAAQAVTVNLATGTAADGEGGNDTLQNIEGVRGSNFGDVLTGGNAAGDDLEFFMGMAGNDTIDGGSGYDRADYNSSLAAVNVTLGGTAAGSAQDGFGTVDVLRNIEGVRGSSFGDTLTGSDSGAFESFEGREGNDLIDGKGGTDRADYVSAIAAVNVNLLTGTAADGYGTTDTLRNIENVRGSSFDDRISGSALANLLQGGAGNDTIGGDAGNDILAGGAGNDSLTGGAGDDQFMFEASGNGVDTLADFVRGDTILVHAAVTGTSKAGNGTTTQAGAMEVATANGKTTLFIGTDSVAGADVQISLNGTFKTTDFVALSSADGYTSIGLAAASGGWLSDLADLLRPKSSALADLIDKFVETPLGHLIDGIEKVNLGHAGYGDDIDCAGAGPAGAADDLVLVGVQPPHVTGH